MSAGPQAGPKRISDGELEALCRLLIDEEGRALEKIRADLSVFLHGDLSLKDKILARKDWASNPRLQELLAELRWGDIARSIEDHMRLGEPRPDLEEAHVLLSSFSGTFRSREDITLPLDRMAEELSPSIEDAPDPDSVIRVFTHYLFRIQGFRGNLGDYSDPENSFLHRVLQRKMGIPITLSGVCLLLARRLRWNGRPLPLHGIGLPGHFVVQFDFPEKPVYLDPFNHGRLMTRADCLEIVRTQKIPFQDSYLRPMEPRAIFARMITNLVCVYSDRDDLRKRDQLLAYLKLLSPGRDNLS